MFFATFSVKVFCLHMNTNLKLIIEKSGITIKDKSNLV